jgi:hypothetical protein
VKRRATGAGARCGIEPSAFADRESGSIKISLSMFPTKSREARAGSY